MRPSTPWCSPSTVQQNATAQYSLPQGEQYKCIQGGNTISPRGSSTSSASWVSILGLVLPVQFRGSTVMCSTPPAGQRRKAGTGKVGGRQGRMTGAGKEGAKEELQGQGNVGREEGIGRTCDPTEWKWMVAKPGDGGGGATSNAVPCTADCVRDVLCAQCAMGSAVHTPCADCN